MSRLPCCKKYCTLKYEYIRRLYLRALWCEEACRQTNDIVTERVLHKLGSDLDLEPVSRRTAEGVVIINYVGKIGPETPYKEAKGNGCKHIKRIVYY